MVYENEYYKQLFIVADKNNDQIIDKNEAYVFFMKSNLDRETLKNIWYNVDIKRSGTFDQNEFKLACTYIYLKQKESDLNALLPRFDIPELVEMYDEYHAQNHDYDADNEDNYRPTLRF